MGDYLSFYLDIDITIVLSKGCNLLCKYFIQYLLPNLVRLFEYVPNDALKARSILLCINTWLQCSFDVSYI